MLNGDGKGKEKQREREELANQQSTERSRKFVRKRRTSKERDFREGSCVAGIDQETMRRDCDDARARKFSEMTINPRKEESGSFGSDDREERDLKEVLFS